MDKEIYVKVVLNFRDNYFHSFECGYVCDFEFTNNKNAKSFKKKIRDVYDDDRVTKPIRKTIFARQKN